MSLLKKKPGYQYAHISKCEGIFLFESNGRRLMDTSSGVALCNLGHANPDILQAFGRIDASVPWVHAGSFVNSHAERLAERLVSKAPGLSYALFLTSGTEAVESAIKHARQYFSELGMPEKSVILTAKQSYHGASNQSLALSGNIGRKGALSNVKTYIADTYFTAYSPSFNARGDLDGYEAALLDSLKQQIQEIGSTRIAGLLLETITGSSNPAVKPRESFCRQLSEICEQNNILLILDEVMCGLGRCGEWYAYAKSGLRPDVVAVGKGLAAGYAPISAVLISQRVHDAVQLNSGAFVIGQTYNNFPISCFIADHVISYIESRDLIEQATCKSLLLKDMLMSGLEGLNVRRIENHGLFFGLEFHDFDDETRPMNYQDDYCEKISQFGKENGLYIYPCQGSRENNTGHAILVAPPFTITHHELDDCAALLVTTVNQYLESERRSLTKTCS
jgi:adenosylmethionine-8-amino-7-oxononanoate aminotransferase